MSRIRFYADEQISKAVVRGLRSRGIDVQTTHDANLLGASDAVQLAHAHESDRVVLTQDNDFLILASEGASHSGIVYSKQNQSIGKTIQNCVLLVEVVDSDEMQGMIEFL